MTPDGITFKAKRKQRTLEVSWEKIFGAAAMIDDNEGILVDACQVAFREISYKEVQSAS